MCRGAVHVEGRKINPDSKSEQTSTMFSVNAERDREGSEEVCDAGVLTCTPSTQLVVVELNPIFFSPYNVGASSQKQLCYVGKMDGEKMQSLGRRSSASRLSS